MFNQETLDAEELEMIHVMVTFVTIVNLIRAFT
jgi:hypothetical protein